MIAPLLALLLLLMAPAGAASPPVQGPCSQGSCTWFRVLEDRVEGSSWRGTLLRLRLRWWDSADPSGRGEARARTDRFYALCSAREPALVERRGRGWWHRPLDPGAKDQVGADRLPLAIYAYACHDIAVGDDPSPALMARYPNRTGRNGSQARPLARPTEALH